MTNYQDYEQEIAQYQSSIQERKESNNRPTYHNPDEYVKSSRSSNRRGNKKHKRDAHYYN